MTERFRRRLGYARLFIRDGAYRAHARAPALTCASPLTQGGSSWPGNGAPPAMSLRPIKPRRRQRSRVGPNCLGRSFKNSSALENKRSVSTSATHSLARADFRCSAPSSMLSRFLKDKTVAGARLRTLIRCLSFGVGPSTDRAILLI
jgi:hypothetical protein